jgi:hypothetical protein
LWTQETFDEARVNRDEQGQFASGGGGGTGALGGVAHTKEKDSAQNTKGPTVAERYLNKQQTSLELDVDAMQQADTVVFGSRPLEKLKKVVANIEHRQIFFLDAHILS